MIHYDWCRMENILTMKWSNDIIWKIFWPRDGRMISYDICLTMRLGCVWVCIYIYIYIYIVWLIEIRDFRGSYSFIFNNSTGKQFLLSQAFTNFHNLRHQGRSIPDDANCENLWKLGTINLFSGGIIENKWIYIYITTYFIKNQMTFQIIYFLNNTS